jgi:hypothetical protein
MKNKAHKFLLVTKQLVGSSIGVSIASSEEDGIKALTKNSALEVYLNLKTIENIEEDRMISEFAEKIYSGILSEIKDSSDKIEASLAYIKKLHPSQTTEIDKLVDWCRKESPSSLWTGFTQAGFLEENEIEIFNVGSKENLGKSFLIASYTQFWLLMKEVNSINETEITNEVKNFPKVLLTPEYLKWAVLKQKADQGVLQEGSANP